MQTIKDLGSYTFPALLKNSIAKFSDRIALSLVNGNPMTYKEMGKYTLFASYWGMFLFFIIFYPDNKGLFVLE